MVGSSGPTYANVSFVEIMSAENRSEVKLYNIIAMRSLRKFLRGEKFYPSDGSEYPFPVISLVPKTVKTFYNFRELIRFTYTTS